MKKKIIYAVFPLMSLLLLTNGCSEDFVETKPIAKASAETFYSTMTSADMATTVCYSMFNLEKVWDLCIMMTMGSIASDEAEAGAGGKTDVTEFQHIDQLRHTPSEANVFEWTWGYLYRAIGYCNVALQELPKISAETDPAFNAGLIKKRLAEVHFLRAFNYFTLTQLYGGVPVVDHVQEPAEFDSPRNEIYEVYDLIKQDLEIAINDLPEKSQWGPNNIGRASKGAAKSLLAKVYLYESSYAKYCSADERFKGLNQEWQKAADLAESVINSNEYELVGINGERFNTWRGPNTGGYQWIFMLDGDNSAESVFEVQNAQDGRQWWDTRGEGLVRWCAPRVIERNDNQNHVDYGWGWWCPTDFLVNSYEAGDPRYKATVMEDGDSVLCNVAQDGGVAWRKVNYDLLKEGTGLHRSTRKYECSYDEFWKSSLGWSDGPINIKLMRYADVVLFAAEANFELGNQAKAVQYVNMVRTRARMSGDTGVPADLTSVTHDDIVHERLVELALEGHRFFDLVRWNLASKYLNHTLADGDQVEFVVGKHEFYPIPAQEIGITKGVLQQYPAWQ